MSYTVGVVCAAYYENHMGHIVLQARTSPLRDLAHERRGYGPMVQLYADLDAESLRAEVRQFLTAAGLTCAPQGVVGQP